MSAIKRREPRWKAAPSFVLLGLRLPAVRCPLCNNRVIASARSMSVHASIGCPMLPQEEDQ